MMCLVISKLTFKADIVPGLGLYLRVGLGWTGSVEFFHLSTGRVGMG